MAEEIFNEQEVEEELDSFILKLANQIKQQELGTSIINPVKIAQINYIEGVLKKIIIGEDVEISTHLHEPFNSMGYISICGKEFEFAHTDIFRKIVGCAANIEVYHKLDKTIQMNLTFYDLTIKID